MSDERDIVEELRHTPEAEWSQEDEQIAAVCDAAADEIERLRADRDRLVTIVRQLINNRPSDCCENFHHEPTDRHDFAEPCPVAARWNAAIEAAEAAAASAKGGE